VEAHLYLRQSARWLALQLELMSLNLAEEALAALAD